MLVLKLNTDYFWDSGVQSVLFTHFWPFVMKTLNFF